jgi:transcription factor SPN1
MPPEQANKIRLDMQLEAILKPKRGNRRTRKTEDGDDLDRFADAEVAKLREDMIMAADADSDANSHKLPALSKLKMLPEVLSVLRKAALAQSIIDNNLLEGVKRWLEPLPDRSLPALNIQHELMALLKRMDFIDIGVLKESKLGRVVLFYTKCKRVTPAVGRDARELIEAWSRPIIKRSASYRDREITTLPMATDPYGNAQGGGVPSMQREKLGAIMARAKERDRHKIRKNAVSIPVRELGTYTVAPRSDFGLSQQNRSVDVDMERRRARAERLRGLTRKVGRN